MPIYGFPFMLHGNARNARDLGYTDDKIIIGKNGQIVEFTKDDFRVTNAFISHRLTTVDGNMIGYTREDILHDRYQLSIGGAVTVSIAKKADRYLFQFATNGIPRLDEFPKLQTKIEDFLNDTLSGDMSRFKDVEHFKKTVAKKIGDLIFDELAKEPIVTVLVH